ncbi:MAG TPA: type I DNA topoisomerase [Candidatus Babeliales bacterium]|jgi:DNA topoisomerase-1|nr:type I DNA topoisomerase [Candidatus Babeliales bacterium]
MKKLIIVESPAKIKTIAKFLDKDYVIMSTMGHIKDLPSKSIGVTMDKKGVHLEYVTLEGKDATIASICKQASTCDTIFIAPDPDREGEIIGWHIAQEINKVAKKGTKTYRIAFNEITEPAILEAINHPGEINMRLVEAQQARRVLDRWVGYEVSPILWRKIAKGLSAGRVQSVALRMICDRETAIRNFVPEEYWSITGNFAHKKAMIAAPLTNIGKEKADVKDEKTAKKIIEALKNEKSYTVDSITDKTRTRNPLPPFMTSTLQQAAYNLLGFSVKKTMQLAQHLYEGLPLTDPSTPVALITYMRTDSLRISDTALTQTRSYISKNFPKEYLPTKANMYEKKSKGKTQDAHEAIRPINVTLIPEKIRQYLPPDEAKLYDLIWKRFVACQMKPAEYAQRQVVIKGGIYTFKVTGSTLIFDGFLHVYQEEEEGEKEEKVNIPADLQAKNNLDLKKIDPKQHFTQPPARFTEASLVKELEKEGIGRPSTYVAVLNTIRARSYTNLEKKKFVPTELGMTVTEMLVKNLPEIMSPKFTAQMEEELDKIAEGELDRDTLLRNFHETFEKDLAAFAGKDGGKKAVEIDMICPQCGKHKLAIRFGKSGEFLGCTGFPECTFTSNFMRDEHGTLQLKEHEAPKLLDKQCPTCGKQLRQLKGKYGDFIACSGYPECKYVERKTLPFHCPESGDDIIERAWRGGKFWGCSAYPKCKFAIFDPIEEKPCPQCKWPFLVRKTNKEGETTLMCLNKECNYKSA